MTLNLYRRHGAACTGGRAQHATSYESDERRRGWKGCACPIYGSGTLAGRFSRRNTERTAWDEAAAVARAWEGSGTWDPLPKVEKPAPQVSDSLAPETPAALTITDATEAYLSNRRQRGIEPSTLLKYSTFVKQLRTYCDGRGYVYITQLSVLDMDRFYASWKDGKRSRAKKLERLKQFIRFCIKRKWITEHIAEDLEAPEGSSIPANKTPFTDEELSRIYAACDAFGDPTPPGPGYRDWSGEDVKDFIFLSVYTGMRISDVSTFDISQRLIGNDVFLRMHKTKKELYTWVPDWLVERLRARERKHGALIFLRGESTGMRAMAEVWRRKLDKVFKRAGHFDEKPIPHRLRHTFVRILLESGVPIADVAELIGDTEEIVRRHYAKWVPERQARLTRILQDALAPKQPKLVA